jgi:hypothetical protein
MTWILTRADRQDGSATLVVSTAPRSAEKTVKSHVLQKKRFFHPILSSKSLAAARKQQRDGEIRVVTGSALAAANACLPAQTARLALTEKGA